MGKRIDGPVAVLGAGTMGHGIAHVAALAGYETTIYDANPEAARNGIARIRANLDKGVELGKVEAQARDAALGRVRAADSLVEAVSGAAFVIEAVPERLDLKRELLAETAGYVAADTILASNTSSISITAIAEVVSTPERVVGMHFFNPVHIMKLVEIVTGDRSAVRAVEAARGLALDMGKTPILVKDTPGFASSRLGVALGLEAMRMLQEGVASPEDIDTAMVLGYGHPMGPLRLTDLIGLDVRLEIAHYLHRELGGDRYRPPQILEDMVAEGKLGKKTGEGFYRWD